MSESMSNRCWSDAKATPEEGKARWIRGWGLGGLCLINPSQPWKFPKTDFRDWPRPIHWVLKNCLKSPKMKFPQKKGPTRYTKKAGCLHTKKTLPHVLPFLKFPVLPRKNPQINQGFLSPAESTKTLKNLRNTHTQISKESPCLKLTKEFKKTKERKDRARLKSKKSLWGVPALEASQRKRGNVTSTTRRSQRKRPKRGAKSQRNWFLGVCTGGNVGPSSRDNPSAQKMRTPPPLKRGFSHHQWEISVCNVGCWHLLGINACIRFQCNLKRLGSVGGFSGKRFASAQRIFWGYFLP